MKYQFEHHPNPQCITLHVDVELPYVTERYKAFGDEEVDEEDRQFFADLIDIRGIQYVSLGVGGRYQASFTKGSVFDWEPIKAEVLEVFRRRFCPNGPMVENRSVTRWAT